MCRISITNRGPDDAPIHVDSAVAIDPYVSMQRRMGARFLYGPAGSEALFTDNETNGEAVYGPGNQSRSKHTKDAFHRAIVNGDRAAAKVGRRSALSGKCRVDASRRRRLAWRRHGSGREGPGLPAVDRIARASRAPACIQPVPGAERDRERWPFARTARQSRRSPKLDRGRESDEYLHVRLQDGETWRYQPPASHDVGWVAVNEGKLHVGGAVVARQMAVFDEGDGVLELRAEGATELVLGSAAKHPYPLVCGSYSVHTSERALVVGEDGIRNVASRLGPKRALVPR